MKRLTKSIATLACALLACPIAATAQVTVTTGDGNGADAFISNDTQGSGYGPDDVCATDKLIIRHWPDVRLKMSVLRFEKPTNLVNYAGSTISMFNQWLPQAREIDVYGLVDGDPGETWDESTLTFNTTPGVSNTANAQWEPMTNLVYLGAMPAPTTELAVYTAAPSGLASFLENDTDGLVTLILDDADKGANGNSEWETKDGSTNTTEWPTLTMPNAVTDPGLPNLTWAVGDGTWDIATTASWNDGGGAAVYQEVSGIGSRVQFDDSASGTSPITITLDTSVMPRSLTNSASKDYIITGFGGISGGTGITKEGSGTLTLDTYNAFTGPVDLNSGTLMLGPNSFSVSLGGASALNLNGGTLAWADGVTEDVSINGLDGSPRTVSLNGDTTLDTGANTISLTSTIGNDGSGGLTKTGSGTLYLAATNSYLGNTVVGEGELVMNGPDALANSPAIIVNSGATLNGNYSTVILNSDNNQVLAGAGTVAAYLTATNNTVITPGTNGVVGTLTIGREFNGDGSLTVEGGKIVMDVSTAGPNDLIHANGNLTFMGGTIELNVSGTLANGTYKIMEYDSASGYFVSGLGSMAVTGFAQAGQVAFLSDGTAGRIDLVVAPLSSKNLVWRGTDANWDVASSMSWLEGATPSEFNHGDAVTFDATGSGLPTVNLQTLLFPSAITVDASTDYSFEDGTGTGGGRISGTVALTKSGSGTLTVNTVNNNSGGSTVNGGSLVVGGHIGSGSVENNAAVVFNQTENRTMGAITGTGSLTQQGSATLTIASAGYTGPTTISSGTLQIGTGGAIGAIASSAINDEGTLGLNTSDDVTLPATVTGGGGLLKRGSGTLTIPAAGYTGATTIDADGGTIVAGAANVVSGPLTVQANGTFDLNGYDQSPMGLASTTFAGGVITNSAATTNVLTVTVNDANDATITVNGPIQFVKLGTNELVMRADAATYTGGTVVGEGTLQGRGGSGSGFFGTGPITLSNNVAFQYDNFPGNELMVVAGATATLRARALGDSYAGPLVSGDTSSTLIIGNALSMGLNNSQQFSNFTGTVILSTNAGSEIRFSSTSLTVNGGEQTRFDLQGAGLIHTRNGTSEGEGAGVFMGSLTGSTNARLEGATSQNRVTRYVIGGNNLSTEYAGTVGLEAGGGNPVAIMKVGTGTLTLSGTNRYESSTVVSNGVLALTGTEANPTNTSSVTVLAPGSLDVSGLTGGTLYLANSNGVTLGGDGTITGSVLVDPAVPVVTVAPGASAGQLTVSGALTLTANTTINMELDNASTPTSDKLVATGGLTLGGAAITVTNIGPMLSLGETFALFDGAISGNGAVTIATEDAYATYTWTDNLGSDGTITVASVVPKVNTNPTDLTYTFDPGTGQLTIQWPTDHTGWSLQVQTNTLATGLSTNWTPIVGTESADSYTTTVNPDDPTVFFRLTYQVAP